MFIRPLYEGEKVILYFDAVYLALSYVLLTYVGFLVGRFSKIGSIHDRK